MSAPSSPLRTAISLQVMALVCAVLAAFGLALWRGERLEAQRYAGAERVEAEVVAFDSDGATVRYRSGNRTLTARLDDRGTRERRIGERIPVELPRGEPDRPVHRVSPGSASGLGIGICALFGALSAAVMVQAMRIRRRLPRLELRARPRADRMLSALPEFAFAGAFAGIWLAPGLLPRGMVELADLAMLFETVLMVLASLVVPVLIARVRRASDWVAVALVGLVAWKATDFFARPGDWAPWIMLGTLVASRAWILFGPRRSEPLPEIERWVYALLTVVGGYWIAIAIAAVLPLPGVGLVRPMPAEWAAPNPTTLLWGIIHFTWLGIARVRDWPSARAEHEPPPAPRALQPAGRRGTK